MTTKALNNDLPSTLTVHQVAETRSSHDRPVDANMASTPDNIICNMVSGSLIGGRRLGPNNTSLTYILTNLKIKYKKVNSQLFFDCLGSHCNCFGRYYTILLSRVSYGVPR